jgi:DNA-binding HxlR family transcriptional regulator
MEDGTFTSPSSPEVTEVCRTKSCELRELLDRLADKWSLLVIELLGDGTQRFTELRKRIEGISQRMLTVTLRQLERDGLIRRTVYPVIPPRVEYDLTPLGGTLLEHIQPLVGWIRTHREDIATARVAYDVRVAQEQRAPSGGSAPSIR